MKRLRDSDELFSPKQRAPIVPIGDDVKIRFN